MDDNFKESKEFYCEGCGLIFKVQKVLNEEAGDKDFNIVQKVHDDEGTYYEPNEGTIYCPRCGDDEAHLADDI